MKEKAIPWRDGAIAYFVIGATAWFLFNKLYKSAVRSMLERAVSIQTKAIQEFQPSIVIAASFGAAVAVECMKRGVWKGPTVLLAPSARVIAKKAGLSDPEIPRGMSYCIDADCMRKIMFKQIAIERCML